MEETKRQNVIDWILAELATSDFDTVYGCDGSTAAMGKTEAAGNRLALLLDLPEQIQAFEKYAEAWRDEQAAIYYKGYKTAFERGMSTARRRGNPLAVSGAQTEPNR
jgi:hypothetical protein